MARGRSLGILAATAVVGAAVAMTVGAGAPAGAVSAPAWAAATAPTPSNALKGANATAGASAVTCPTPGYCVSVGYYKSSITPTTGRSVQLADIYSGGNWTVSTVPSPPGSASTRTHQFGALTSLSCTGPGSCLATGATVTTSGNDIAFIAALNGTTWSTMQAPLPANAAHPASSGTPTVACSAPNSCVVGGVYEATTDGYHEFVDTLSGGQWSTTELPQPPHALAGSGANGELRSISCSSPANCAASRGVQECDNRV